MILRQIDIFLVKEERFKEEYKLDLNIDSIMCVTITLPTQLKKNINDFFSCFKRLKGLI